MWKDMGWSIQGIDFADDNNVSLIIALDCGIKSIEEVAYAARKGIDFIICDHHRPGEQLPEAIAVLDPKRQDCHYPYDELCGCGVGFKLIQALAHGRGQNIEDLLPFLDLVATAIAADIVPVTGENRVLAYFGLEVLNSKPRPGIYALMTFQKKREMTLGDVVFIIAPRINAAGRIRHGQHAVNLLTESDYKNATILAREIEDFNSDRRELDQLIKDEALTQILEKQEEKRFTTVVFNENWHKGVIGIVASRLIETYYRPTLVFTKSGDKLAASARSVKGFDVYNALEACAEYIEQFGGHKYAAGLTLTEAQYPMFKERFEEVVSKTIDPNLLIPEILIDDEIPLSSITPKFYRILKQIAPFGPGNLQPVFISRNVYEIGQAKCVGKDESHLRAVFQQDGSDRFVSIGFGLGKKLDLLANQKRVDIVYSIDENEWNGSVSLQLRIRDIRPSSMG